MRRRARMGESPCPPWWWLGARQGYDSFSGCSSMGEAPCPSWRWLVVRRAAAPLMGISHQAAAPLMGISWRADGPANGRFALGCSPANGNSGAGGAAPAWVKPHVRPGDGWGRARALIVARVAFSCIHSIQEAREPSGVPGQKCWIVVRTFFYGNDAVESGE